MKSIKDTLRGIVPAPLINTYHRICAFLAALLYHFPAQRMFVIGVTGTKGKTSTSNYIWSVLDAGGYNAGLMTTANFKIGDEEELNTLHMSMPNPFVLQRKLREMVYKGVTVAVVEMTSQGMEQYRHEYIPVDIAVFTNLTPEHIASHGSFEAYKKAKTPLFRAFSHKPRTISGMTILRTIIANADSEHADYYLQFPADKKITFGLQAGEVRAEKIESRNIDTKFFVQGETFRLSIPGAFNVYNALPAIIVGHIFSISSEKIAGGLTELAVIPGRMEIIQEGQPFTVIVDFAHEAASMTALLDSVKSFKKENSKIILLSGAAGGGRERGPMTVVGAKAADTLVLTIEDTYLADPKVLLDSVVEIAVSNGKRIGVDLFPIVDRKLAIEKALSLATPNDIVLITGKGGEQVMVTKNGPTPWDERTIVRKAVKKYNAHNN